MCLISLISPSSGVQRQFLLRLLMQPLVVKVDSAGTRVVPCSKEEKSWKCWPVYIEGSSELQIAIFFLCALSRMVNISSFSFLFCLFYEPRKERKAAAREVC